jgi:hypothetical protein
MKANELRIGNWVNEFRNVERKLFKHQITNADDIKCFEDKWVHYEPIPLTEEWLLSFNINELKEQDVYRVNYVDYHKKNNTFNYCLGYYFNEEGYIENIFKKIKYVHQLQNLYFALTGEELTIKE